MAPTLQKLGHKLESLSVIDVQAPFFEDVDIREVTSRQKTA